jgi:drug/metabolite transporter (DMT)-like permease
VGVIASVVMLGERPTQADLIGFALIFVAALIALRPERRSADMQERAA